MRIMFLGTPEPAARLLEYLIKEKHEIVCVVTQPDRPRGRGKKVSFSAVKETALKLFLPLEQPEKVKNNEVFASKLKELKPDIAVVVAYGKILPKDILDIPKFGFINVHASLLPKYRGAAPIQWVLLNGEKETGITIFKLTELLDAGPILLQEKINIEEDDDAQSLSLKLFKQAEPLLSEALIKIEEGKAVYSPQNEKEVSFAPTLTKESGEIDWEKNAREIHNRVRGLVSWPVAHTYYKDKILRVFKSKIQPVILSPGEWLPGAVVEIVKDEGFIVAAGAGFLLITEVQPEAGKRMPAYSFVIGHGLKKGDLFPG